MINIKMPDAEFDLRNISDIEIFNAIKDEVINAIKTFKGYENIKDENIRLNTQYTNRQERFGKDYNLYPFIVLDVGAKVYFTYDSFNIFITPFNINIAPYKYNAEAEEFPDLTKSFVKFMTKKFPDSNYMEKRKEYFKKAQIRERIQNDLLSF